MCSTDEYHVGRADAERDIQAGRLAREVFLAPWTETGGLYILEERYGIKWRMVGTDLVTQKSLDHARGYNEIMEAEIERRFGVGVIEAAEAEAEANRKPTPPMSSWH